MTGDDWDPDDVLVVIGHPFGDLEVPLTRWMAQGPGPRHGIRPQSARSGSTGESLPLTVIPLAYRNNREARALIAAGRIDPPWRAAWNTELWGEQPCELGGPRAFDKTVPDPDRVDAIAAQMLERKTVDQVVVPDVVRRLAAEARWEDFDTIVDLAAAAGLADIGPVLCELLESDANPPRPGHIVEVLGRLRYGAAAELLERLLGRFVYADNDLVNARRCLRTMRAIGKPEMLPLIAWGDWPDPIPQWAAAELPAWRA